MYTIHCEKCGTLLEFDNQETMKYYLPKIDYIKFSIEESCDIALAKDLYYKCTSCDSCYKYTFKDIEYLARKAISKDIMHYRKIHVFRNDINTSLINQDNGITFCGLCEGIDNEGTCYNDVIAQCSFRRGPNEL